MMTRLRAVWRALFGRMPGVQVIEIEARHGAHRTRVNLEWHGDGHVLRVEIPINRKPEGTSTPMGYVAPGDEQRLVDCVTGIEGRAFPNIDDVKVERRCPFCGQQRKVP